jgi:hypothetical protein
MHHIVVSTKSDHTLSPILSKIMNDLRLMLKRGITPEVYGVLCKLELTYAFPLKDHFFMAKALDRISWQPDGNVRVLRYTQQAIA